MTLLTNNVNSKNKNYFSHQQNAFINPNLRATVMKTISAIISGQRIRSNQHQLHQLRTQPQYPLILCQLLTTLHKNTLMQQNTFQTNKKNFILLEIKKNISRLKNEQCWWLMRDVYFCDNDKTAQMIRQICLSFERQTCNTNGDDLISNYLSIFFNVNLQNLGLVGIVRYLLLVHGLLTYQYKNLQNGGIIKYGEMIERKIFESLQWDIPGYVLEFAMTCLIMLQGFLMKQKCQKDKSEQRSVLMNLLQTREQHALLSCLIMNLLCELNLKMIPLDRQNKQQQQQRFLQSIKYCLSQTRQSQNQFVQKLFYADCLSILNLQWRKDIKVMINQRRIKDNQQYIFRVIQVYKDQFTLCLDRDKKWVNSSIDQDYQDQQSIIFQQKRCSILISTFQLINREDMFSIILKKDSSYMLTFMHLSTHCPQLRKYASSDVDGCLNMLSCALRGEKDTYLFYKEKGQLIDIVIRHVAKYYRHFQPQLLLKASYLIDLLANKCDTIAEECYQLLSLFAEELQHFYASQLIEFVQTSLTNINNNEWQHTSNCYSHVIKLITSIDPIVIFDNTLNNHFQLQGQKQTTSLFSSFQSTANPMQKNILQMVKNMITSLQINFDYQQMHQLNTILQYLLNHAPHICHQLTYRDFNFIVKSNFTYQILTTQSADVYYYFTQFSQQKHIFINSVNLYQFWELCQSQKLQFFVHVYLKLIHPQSKFFTSSQIDHKLNQLKKNLWHRFASEEDEDQRQKIVTVFEKHPQQLNSLFEEFHKITLWGQIKNHFQPLTDKDHMNQRYCPPKMEFE